MISGEHLPILTSFSRDSRAFLNDIFCNLNNSTTILGVTINGTLKNLAALIALPSSVANSKGITDDELPKVFEPFFTTKDVDKGTGLGLSLAHLIIDRHRGTIGVESTVDQGTRFTIKMQPVNNSIKEEKNNGQKKNTDNR